MRRPTWLGIVVAAALAVAVGTGGGGGVSGPVFPPGVEELLPQAVTLWEAAVLRVGALEVLQVLLVLDVNGDEVMDVVTSESSGLVVFLGTGQGRFTRGCAGFYEVESWPVGGGSYLSRPLATMTALSGAVLRIEGRERIVVATAGVQFPNGPYGYWLYMFEHRSGCLKRLAATEVPFPLHFLEEWPFADGSRLLGASVQDDQTQVVVLTADGSRFFSAPVVVGTARGWPVHWGDVTADGEPDLVLLLKDEVVVLPSLGGGRLGSPIHVATPEQRVWDVAVGDITGDEVPELVVLTGANKLVTYGWSGSSLEVQAIQELDARHALTGLKLADMTGEGVLDLVAFGAGRQWIAVLPGKGNGSFSSRGSEFWLPVPSLRQWVVDLTGSGKADLLVASPYTAHVLVNGGYPAGVSQLPVAEILAVGDLSGDGSADLLFQTGKGVDVLWNNGEGAFLRSRLTTFPEPGPETTLVDRGWGLAELVVEDQTEWVLRSLQPVAAQVMEGSVLVLLRRTEADSRTLWDRAVHELRWISAEGALLRAVRLPREEVAPGLGVGDFDGDGAIDVAVLVEGDVWIWWGGSEEAVAYHLPTEAFLLAVGEANGDGVDDVVIVGADQNAHVRALSFSNRALDLSDPWIVFDPLALPLALTLGDFDKDGVDDVAVAASRVHVDLEEVVLQGGEVWIRLGKGEERIILIPSWPEGQPPWPGAGLVAGDFNGDGRVDLALTTAGAMGVFVLLGEGDGSFSAPRQLWAPAGALRAGDLDGNGRLELIAHLLGLNPATWILWNGGGL